jgi:hypothetical protein
VIPGFVSPMLMLSYACGDIGKSRESKMWAYKAYNRIEDMPHELQMQIRELKLLLIKILMNRSNHLRNIWNSIRIHLLSFILWAGYIILLNSGRMLLMHLKKGML